MKIDPKRPVSVDRFILCNFQGCEGAIFRAIRLAIRGASPVLQCEVCGHQHGLTETLTAR